MDGEKLKMSEKESPKFYCRISGKWCNNYLCEDCEEYKDYDWSGESIFQPIWEKMLIYHYLLRFAKKLGPQRPCR